MLPWLPEGYIAVRIQLVRMTWHPPRRQVEKWWVKGGRLVVQIANVKQATMAPCCARLFYFGSLTMVLRVRLNRVAAFRSRVLEREGGKQRETSRGRDSFPRWFRQSSGLVRTYQYDSYLWGDRASHMMEVVANCA